MKNTAVVVLLALAAGAVAGATVVSLSGGREAATTSKTETAYERIIRTQTLRCGYVPFVPNLVKDLNTGKFSGIDYDVAEALGRKLGLKVVWAEEVGWATVVPGLKAGKYDALCNAAWYNPMEGKEAYFSRPYYYQPLFIAVRADDTRFDSSAGAINDPNVKVASLDGDNPRFIAEEDFPKAQVFTLPDMSDMATVMESVATRKADVTFLAANNFIEYDEHNSGKLKLAQTASPVRIFPVGFVLPMGDDRLKAMIDIGLDELIYSGQVDKILAR
ncbi:MAG: transporter substrate-binding domain-containing protein [Alphaproteobacteria bacterium]|nr:transporter substrate-binding domain-containing protein [Alphaproteobacteria bacterium]